MREGPQNVACSIFRKEVKIGEVTIAGKDKSFDGSMWEDKVVFF